MRLTNVIHTVDAHAEGEPSRVVVGGVLDVPGDSMFAKKQYLETCGDELRRFLLFEPRGSAPLSADLVLPPTVPEADAGFIIMESTDYPPMSGTNTICTATVLLETGMLPMTEPVTTLTLETPAGLVKVVAECGDGKCRRVKFTNLPSFAVHLDRRIEVPEIGSVVVDVAYGGAFFAVTEAAALGFQLVAEEAAELARIGQLIKRAAAEQLPVVHPENEAVNTITFTTFVGPSQSGADIRSATVVSPGRLDRSPCGTATCALLAILAGRRELSAGQSIVNESLLSTRFVGQIEGLTSVGPYSAVIPSISGRAWITGVHQLSRDPSDPFAGGFCLPDTWGIAARTRLPVL